MNEHTVTCGETMEAVLTPRRLQNTCERLIAKIEETKIQFEGIAFTGFSGALVAPVLCVLMNKYPIVIRKDDENNHTCYSVEGPNASMDYIIVDDLMCTCTSVNRILSKVSNLDYPKRNYRCRGLFLYNQKNYAIESEGYRVQDRDFPIFYYTPDEEWLMVA
jgi:hypothetical protein